MSDFVEDYRKWCKEHPIQSWLITKKIRLEYWYQNTWLGRKWYGDWWLCCPIYEEPIKIEVPWQIRYYVWKMRRAGFNPLWYTWYIGEHTFIFETGEEAHRAYEQFEDEALQAWWWGMDTDKIEIDDKFLENCVEI